MSKVIDAEYREWMERRYGPENPEAMRQFLTTNPGRDAEAEFKAETSRQSHRPPEEIFAEATKLMEEMREKSAIRPLPHGPGPETLGSTGDPKKEAGSQKPSVRSVSPIATWLEGYVMSTGEEKYGIYNYAEHSMSASTYYDAIRRHLDQWWTGEDQDIETLVTHLAHIRACTGILIEQLANHKLNDDRAKVLAPVGPTFNYIMDRIKEAQAQKRAQANVEANPPREPTLIEEEEAAFVLDNTSPLEKTSPIDAAVRDWSREERLGRER